jgi:hypothetical protein
MTRDVGCELSSEVAGVRRWKSGKRTRFMEHQTKKIPDCSIYIHLKRLYVLLCMLHVSYYDHDLMEILDSNQCYLACRGARADCLVSRCAREKSAAMMCRFIGTKSFPAPRSFQSSLYLPCTLNYIIGHAYLDRDTTSLHHVVVTQSNLTLNRVTSHRLFIKLT